MKSRNNYNTPLEALSALMSERGMTVDKLAYLTEVPKKFILLIQSGNFQELPSHPYVIAYLKKMASALQTDEQFLLSEYENALSKKNGGDKLPSNRFAKENGEVWQFILIAILVWGVAAFFGYRFNEIAGIPAFKASLPSTVSSPALEISGHLAQGDGISINGQTVNTDANGDFSTTIYLNPGANSFNFVVSRFLGGQASESANVNYTIPSS